MKRLNNLKVWQKVILVILAIGLLIVISPVVAIAALVGVVWFGYFRPDNLKRNISIGVLVVSLVGSFLFWQSRTTQDELDSKQAELNSSTTELREEYESESKRLKDEEEQSKKESASSEAEQSAKDESFESQLESEYSSMIEEDDWSVDEDDLATLDEAMVALINTTDGALTKWEYDEDNRVVYLWTNEAVKANTHDERVWFAEEYGNRALSNATGILFPEKANDRSAVSVYFVYQDGDIWATSEILGDGFNIKD